MTKAQLLKECKTQNKHHVVHIVVRTDDSQDGTETAAVMMIDGEESDNYTVLQTKNHCKARKILTDYYTEHGFPVVDYGVVVC